MSSKGLETLHLFGFIVASAVLLLAFSNFSIFLSLASSSCLVSVLSLIIGIGTVSSWCKF